MNVWNTIVDIWNEITKGASPTRVLFNVAEALLFLIILLFIGRLLKSGITKLVSRTSRNVNFAALLGNLAYSGIIVLAVLVMITILTGTNITNLFTLLGIFSLAFSLAVQDVLKNFVAGIYILLEQPFKIGDEITVREQRGTVESIEIRTTNMRTDNGVQVVVPNSIVFSEILTNRSAYNRRLITVRFTLPSGEDLSAATESINNVFKGLEDDKIATSPSPVVLLENITEGKTTARVEFWAALDAVTSVGPKVALAIKAALPQADVSLA